MKVELILPIARLRGKINSSSPFYFKTVNGKTFVQRCPNRSTKAQNQHLCRQTPKKFRFSLHISKKSRTFAANLDKSTNSAGTDSVKKR